MKIIVEVGKRNWYNTSISSQLSWSAASFWSADVTVRIQADVGGVPRETYRWDGVVGQAGCLSVSVPREPYLQPISTDGLWVEPGAFLSGWVDLSYGAGASIPEPSTLVLFGFGALGFIGYGFRRWRKNRKEK